MTGVGFGRAVTQCRGQGCRRAVVVDPAERNPAAVLALKAAGDHQCLDRLPAEIDEAVVGLAIRYVERPSVDLEYPGLERVRQFTPGRAAQHGDAGQQLLTIGLAIGVQGQGAEQHEPRRDHPRRQLLGETGAEVMRVAASAVADDERHQRHIAARGRVRHDDGLAHAFDTRQSCLDFARLDAIAAHLHLLVSAAVELDEAVRLTPARSPLRYRRVPGASGSGTKRSAVSSGRLR